MRMYLPELYHHHLLHNSLYDVRVGVGVDIGLHMGQVDDIIMVHHHGVMYHHISAFSHQLLMLLLSPTPPNIAALYTTKQHSLQCIMRRDKDVKLHRFL